MLRLLVLLTRFAAQSPLDGADTAIWRAASPEVEGVTGTSWAKRRPVRCRFRDPAAAERVWKLVEQQLGP